MPNTTGLSVDITSAQHRFSVQPSAVYDSQQKVDAIVASRSFKGVMDKSSAQACLGSRPLGYFFLYYDPRIQDFVFCCRTGIKSYHIPLSDIVYNLLDGKFNSARYLQSRNRFDQSDERLNSNLKFIAQGIILSYILFFNSWLLNNLFIYGLFVSLLKNDLSDLWQRTVEETMPEATVYNINLMLIALPPLVLAPPLDMACLPYEVVSHLGRFLSARDCLSLAQTQRCLFFADLNGRGAGLVRLAKEKKIAELVSRVQLIASGSRSACIVENKLYVLGPPSIIDREDGEEVNNISSGSGHTMLLTNRGRCFVWGYNGQGQLGLGDYESRRIPTELSLTDLNLQPGEAVNNIFSGVAHAMLLTNRGRCFVWGNNNRGQLGLGDYESRRLPTELPLTPLNLQPGEAVNNIYAGCNHTILLTNQGRCFVWGNNNRSELGLGDFHCRPLPTELPLTDLNLQPDEKVKNIDAGNTHTTLLTNRGRCFVWGFNEEGHLGLGDYECRPLPTEMPLTDLNLRQDEKVISMVSGEEHIILLTNRGRSFVCGENTYGQLGLGNYNSYSGMIPTEMPLTSLNLQTGEKVKDVVAGYRHAMLLTNLGRCFVWGSDGYGELALGGVLCDTPVERSFPQLQILQCKIQALKASLQADALSRDLLTAAATPATDACKPASSIGSPRR